MVKKLIWTKEAISNLNDIALFISTDSTFYASHFVEEIIFESENITFFPNKGRVIPELNNKYFRETFISNYRLMYEIEDNQIFIQAIVHMKKEFKK